MNLDSQNRFSGSFGPEYEREISKAKAQALLGNRPPPGMGRQKLIVDAGDKELDPDGIIRPRLKLINVSDTYWIRSHNTPVSQWKGIFGIDGLEMSATEIEKVRANAPREDIESCEQSHCEPMVF